MTEESLWGDVREEWKGYSVLSSGKGKLGGAEWLIRASLSPTSLTHLAQSLAKLIWWMSAYWLEKYFDQFC